jgi:flagellar biosynthetic protein FliP
MNKPIRFLFNSHASTKTGEACLAPTRDGQDARATAIAARAFSGKRMAIYIMAAAVVMAAGSVCSGADAAAPATGAPVMPGVGDVLNVIDKATTPAAGAESKNWSGPIRLVIVFTALAILPSLLVMMTSFTRIVIVLSFVRRALTTQTIPPNIAIIGLALFLTLFTMAPTFALINRDAIQPYLANKADMNVAGTAAGNHMKDFMLRQTRQSDLALFVQMAKVGPVSSPREIGLHVVVPAFIISEFRTAFEMGCVLFIPFLLIDLVLAGVLLSAGMMMLPPMMVSLPLKLMLFVLVDGWSLLAKSLSLSFR